MPEKELINDKEPLGAPSTIQAESRSPRLSIAVLLVVYLFLAFVAFATVTHISPNAGYVVGVIALLCAGPLLIVARQRLCRKLKAVEISENGLLAQRYTGRKIDIKWDEVSSVIGCEQDVLIVGSDKRVTIGSEFEHFADIIRAIHKICKQRGIKCKDLDLIDESIDLEPGIVYDEKERPPASKAFNILVMGTIMILIFLGWWLLGAWAFAIGLCVLFPFVVVDILRLPSRKKFLRTIEINEVGLHGVHFGGEKVDISWEEVSKVEICSMPPSRPGYILVEAPGKKLVIDNDFPRLRKMIRLVVKVCEKKDIWCWWDK